MVVLPPVEEPSEYNSNYVLYWNHVGLELNRLTHSVHGGGPQAGPPLSARALGILHLAINDAYFAIHPDPSGSATTYLSKDSSDPDFLLPDPLGARDARLAVAGAAITVLERQYTRPAANIATAATAEITQLLNQSIGAFPNLDTLSSSYRFGIAVGKAILKLLEIGPDEPGAGRGAYQPKPGRYQFDDDPTNPVRPEAVDPNNPKGPTRAVRPYHAPFYGMTARRVAVQMSIDGVPTEHIIADPPVGFGTEDFEEYDASVDEVIRMGGAPEANTTRRRPDQTVAGYYWAYDGVNLLGTPPRLYNQILRQIAWKKKPGEATSEATNADFARLFALANAALADAGIFAWQEKYCFEFWRPLSGVREHGGSLGDPFFLTLGAPNTNVDRISFKPPFPAYPSGHATFGAAFFQMARLYYRRRDHCDYGPDEPDNIDFCFVSEELNGISRDLREPYDKDRPITDQPGTVRTRVPRHFPNLWTAIFENAVSRVYLGVHWRFDAFAGQDALDLENPTNPDGTVAYMKADNIRYQTMGPRKDRPGCEFPIGGVPLGIGIANDIFCSNLRPTPDEHQPSGRDRCGRPIKR
ncbi:MAG: polar growth protein [Watsoniomyces obsoletus]|nr:MAG: polar growth protein [Watsoniomyces obsoletus]